ncbi:MAG: ABC transporter, partial [Thermoprotei archaeon]
MKEILRVHVKEAGYEEDKPILKDTTLVLNEGETLLLVGPTGSGKSTFIILITGVLTNLLYGYVKGSVKLFGINPLDPNDFKVVPR